MKKLLLLFVWPLNAIDLEKYQEIYRDCLFLSREITFFNTNAPVKVNLPKLLMDFLEYKASQEATALKDDLEKAGHDIESIILRKKDTPQTVVTHTETHSSTSEIIINGIVQMCDVRGCNNNASLITKFYKRCVQHK